MQMNVGEKRSTTATVEIMSGENWRELPQVQEFEFAKGALGLELRNKYGDAPDEDGGVVIEGVEVCAVEAGSQADVLGVPVRV